MALPALARFMVREGLLIPFTVRRCYLCAHLHHLHDSVVMIPVASRGQELPETSHFSLAGSELGSVLMRSETMSSGGVCHYFTWQSGSTKTQIMEENDSTYITMPPDETLITSDFLGVKFFLILVSKKPNCLSFKSEKKFPLRKGIVISAHAPDSSSVLKWGMQVQIHCVQCVLCTHLAS